ncbi:MAG TPA: glyoxylate/hydroxypyruvate reductase A [Candidatus Binatia bacterium]|nr:glyoxylate/hydroxypyruvate reductase A [Candidatus Binatia bacterium]
MTILYAGDPVETDDWLGALRALDSSLQFRTWPDWGNPDDIDFIVVGGRMPGDLSIFTKAKAIQSTWAGVNHLLRGKFPAGVPIARMVERALSANMVEYLVYWALDALREGPVFRQGQRDGQWLDRPLRWARDFPIGILGLGTLGQDTAKKLVALGFPVSGWSRTPKSVADVQSFAGPDELAAFLAPLKLMICLLPLTAETENILDAKMFAGLSDGAILVNAGRGGHLHETDLLAALDSGKLAYAVLDVFREEPLPADHPFWRRKDIILTPHIASITQAGAGASEILENYRRALAGQPLLNLVDPKRGY